MGALIRAVSVFLLATATPARADEVDRWRPFVEEASSRLDIPVSWIKQVMRAESRGYTMLNGRPIRSRAGAMGLMQLMPATWTEMRFRLSLGNNPDDPRDNILAGTLFLRLMYDRFGFPGLFGAYNAGPSAYAAFLAGRRRLPGETAAYLSTVGGAMQAGSQPPKAAPQPSLFVVRLDANTDQPASVATPEQPSLFAVRKGSQ